MGCAPVQEVIADRWDPGAAAAFAPAPASAASASSLVALPGAALGPFLPKCV